MYLHYFYVHVGFLCLLCFFFPPVIDWEVVFLF